MKGKYENTREAKRGGGKKVLALALVFVLVFGCAVGGTLAWLKDVTAPIVNTFTTSNIKITLAETTGETYKMVPGDTITKDPVVTVKADSEACWLFVKLEKTDEFDDYLSFTVADGWTNLVLDEVATDIYYREVPADKDDDQPFQVITGNTVSVNDGVTKDQMDALTTSGEYPELTITAYACQSDNTNYNDAAAAWNANFATP